MDKKLMRNFIWNTIGTTLASFNSLFFMIIITRINGLEDAGIFSITFATASLLYIFAIYSGRNGQITDVKNEINDKEYMVSRIITCLLAIVIMIVMVALNQYDNWKNSILICLCIWKFLEAFADVFYAILQKKEELYRVGISLILKSVLGLIIFFLIDLVTKNLLYACLSLIVVSILVMLCYDIPQVRKRMDKNEKVRKENLLKIYQGEFYLFANTFLLMYILNAPKYAIESYLTDEVQAIFGIILMPASIIPLFSQFVMAPIIRKMTDQYKENKIQQMKQLDHKMTQMIIGFGLLATAIGYFIGIPVLNLLYHRNLDVYRMNLVIILLGYILYAAGYIKTISLTIFRNRKELFFVHAFVAILILIISNVAVKYFGMDGASVTYIFAMATYYLVFMWITRRKYQQKQEEANES